MGDLGEKPQKLVDARICGMEVGFHREIVIFAALKRLEIEHLMPKIVHDVPLEYSSTEWFGKNNHPAICGSTVFFSLM